MNKLPLVILVSLLCCCTPKSGTDSTDMGGYTESLGGLGVLEIGKTFSQIKDTLSKNNTPYLQSDPESKTIFLSRGFVDRTDLDLLYIEGKSTDILKEYVTSLIISDSLVLDRVSLSFWRDSLVSVSTYNSPTQLYEYLTIQLGEGKEERLDIEEKEDKLTESISCYWYNDRLSSQYFESTLYKVSPLGLATGILDRSTSLVIMDKSKGKEIENHRKSHNLLKY